MKRENTEALSSSGSLIAASGRVSSLTSESFEQNGRAAEFRRASIRFAKGIELDFDIRSERDETNRARLQDLLDRSPDPFGRSTEVGHVTATAFVVDAVRDSTVLIDHRKLSLWLPPGGHCDGDRDVRRVALREAREETGLRSIALVDEAVFDIDIHTIPANRTDREHLHFDVRFLFEADRDELLTGSSESRALRWVRLDDLPSLTSLPSVLVLKEKLGSS